MCIRDRSCSARGDLIDYYEQYIDRIANASTRGTHEHTLKKILAYDKGKLSFRAVSYTHLDVYKRQPMYFGRSFSV